MDILHINEQGKKNILKQTYYNEKKKNWIKKKSKTINYLET
jgi:hypothetical protein